MDHVLFERDGRVVTITLNRPDRLNAITGPMLAGLSQMLLESDADPRGSTRSSSGGRRRSRVADPSCEQVFA